VSGRILGLRFFDGPLAEAVARGMAGGLVVAPAAPLLVKLGGDAALREALEGADLVLPDSGLMVLCHRVRTGSGMRRLSGLEYLGALLQRGGVGASAFWVMPGEASARRNIAWLAARGIPVAEEDCYIAPRYGAGRIEDAALAAAVERRRPRHIFIALGGGVQERLGWYLRGCCGWGPSIHCTGAAIAFLSGDQVRIPMWADALYLGWLFRCLSDPRAYVPRYWAAVELPYLMAKHGERSPGARG
jgi:UDP-N-acetyl-D-mannosaminuronic acid transferase (WecB/TagA/CpsF family)